MFSYLIDGFDGWLCEDGTESPPNDIDCDGIPTEGIVMTFLEMMTIVMEPLIILIATMKMSSWCKFRNRCDGITDGKISSGSSTLVDLKQMVLHNVGKIILDKVLLLMVPLSIYLLVHLILVVLQQMVLWNVGEQTGMVKFSY